jgi:radical SAM protein with 4Fe4S-binding SPASM domain
MGCNMRCGHCGSSCAEPLPGELTTEEALDAVGQFADMGLRWVTLSGGEPLTRKDWPVLVRALSKQGILVNMITNGWLLKDETARELAESGISTVAVSVDGTEQVHDAIRKTGSYRRVKESFAALNKYGVTCGAVTTVSKENIQILPQIKEELIAMRVSSWQVQLGLPMGNFAEQQSWLLEPAQINDILDFVYETNNERRIVMYPADCLGYYSHKELWARQMAFNTPDYQLWDGCNAGTRGFGFLHNGDILGCTSIRNREYIEGSIRERSLRSIWEDPQKFLWRRDMTKENLSGECKICKYGRKCLGGCPNTRLTVNGTIYGENQYCSYNAALKEYKKQIQGLTDAQELFIQAQRAMYAREYQQSALLLERLFEMKKNDAEGLRLKGFVEFMNGNYELSESANRELIEMYPDDSYAKKGMGLALFRQGKREEGLRLVEEAVRASGGSDRDAMDDLAALYAEMGRG